MRDRKRPNHQMEAYEQDDERHYDLKPLPESISGRNREFYGRMERSMERQMQISPQPRSPPALEDDRFSWCFDDNCGRTPTMERRGTPSWPPLDTSYEEQVPVQSTASSAEWTSFMISASCAARPLSSRWTCHTTFTELGALSDVEMKGATI